MDVEPRLNQIIARLRERGLRLTPQRVAILRALLTFSHPNAEAIHREVAASFPMTGLGTVYSTLALLEEIGEVSELALGGAASHYDGRDPAPHPHLICARCGTIADVELAGLDRLLGWIAAHRPDWQITPRLDIWGLCTACRAADAGQPD